MLSKQLFINGFLVYFCFLSVAFSQTSNLEQDQNLNPYLKSVSEAELDFFIEKVSAQTTIQMQLNSSLLNTYKSDSSMLFNNNRSNMKAEEIQLVANNLQKSVTDFANNLETAIEITNERFGRYIRSSDIAFFLGRRLAAEYNRLVPAGNQEINLSLEDRSKLLKYLLISESIFANTLQKDIDALSRDLVPMRVMVASFGYLLSIGLIASDFLILGFPALGYTMYKSYQALREMKLFDSINPNAIGIRANYFKGRALHNFFLGIKDFISKTEHAYSAQDLSPKSHTQSLSRDIPRHNLEARATLLKVLSSGLGPAQFAKICKNSSLN